MLGARLQKAQEISKKRWDYYHADQFKNATMWLVRGWSPSFPPVGAYKKSTGCMCSGCSFLKQVTKTKNKKAIRRCGDILPDGSFYKRLSE